MDSTVVIRVLTLNCWGIVFVSKDRRARMKAIAKHLSKSDLDFVCLQEVWSVSDFLYLSSKAKLCLPYSHYFNSGVNGPGLCVLSKHPIVDVYFHQWPINGYAHKVHQGDWFGGKGVGLCRIRMGDKTVNLYTTHLHAEYNLKSLEYLGHRILQSFDTSQFIKITSTECDLAILAGDLNSEPTDPAIPLLLLNAQLKDCFRVAQKITVDCEGTNEGHRNSYSPASELKIQPEGKRIDYVMFKNSNKIQVDVLEYQYPLPDRVPGCTFSYSDHEAVQVNLQCSFNIKHKGDGDSSKASNMNGTTKDLSDALNVAADICESSLRQLRITKIKYRIAAVILGVLLLVTLFLELLVPVYEPAGVVFYNFLKVILAFLFSFTGLMGTIWNRIEESAIKTGKYSMRLLLSHLSDV